MKLKICESCGSEFSENIQINGEIKRMRDRKFCLECSPFGLKNKRKDPTEPLTAGHVYEGKCEKHGLTSFVIEKRGTRRCKKCRTEHVTEGRRNRKRQMMARFGSCCMQCGYNKDCPSAYDFHHSDPYQKEFAISEKGFCRDLNKLIDEVDKCLLLCRNCHAEFHAGLITEEEIRKNHRSRGKSKLVSGRGEINCKSTVNQL